MRYITVDKASERTGIPKTTIQKAVKEGAIRSRTLGKVNVISASDLDKWIETKPVKGDESAKETGFAGNQPVDAAGVEELRQEGVF